MEGSTTSDVISSDHSVILSMFHGMWQQRCLSLIVAFEIPELLCNSDHPVHIDDIAAKTNCRSSKQLYPIMRVLAQWGIGKEMKNKHFTTNPTMKLLRRDLGASLGHLVQHYGSEEHLMAMRSMAQCVREGTPAFVLEHGMTIFSYLSDISNQPYDEKKTFYGASKHPIGGDERREELAKNYFLAMDCLSNLTILPDKTNVHNLYNVFPWTSCTKLVDMGGGSGRFLASVLKQPGCDHIQGFLVDLPVVIDKAHGSFPALGIPEHRIQLIKQDFTKPLQDDLATLEADTVMFMNILGYFLSQDQDRVTNILQNTRKMLSHGGRLLIIDNCCPDPGNMEQNVGINGRQLGFHSFHYTSVSGGGFYSKSEWISILQDIGSKSGYKLSQTHDTFTGGYTIFELAACG